MEYNSFSQLRRLKMQAGVGIDTSASSSAYILESKIKRDIERAYDEDHMLNTRFQQRLGKNNLTRIAVLRRIEKMEEWRLRVIRQVIDEQGAFEAIVKCYTMRKSDKREYVKPEADADEFDTEPTGTENFV